MTTPKRRFSRPPGATRRIQRDRRGFTLMEVLVSFIVLVMIFGTVLYIFTANDRLARVQTHVAEMQQSLRIAQHDVVRTVRMAGRGGVPRGNMPDGLALSVRNNVPESGDEHYIAIGDADSPEILAGTDVLTVRGVLESPIFQANPVGGTFNLDSPVNPTRGNIRLQNPSPTTGVPQDLRYLSAAIDRNLPEALILVSPLADEIYAVVELDAGNSSINASDPEGVVSDVTLAFRIHGGTHTADYLALSPGGVFPTALRSVAFVGLLEEHRFYVKEDHSIAGDDTSELMPRLARARMYPGTQSPYAGSPLYLGSDISDGIVDLQIALGIDVDGDDEILEDPLAPGNDEWLYNSPDDNPTAVSWDGVTSSPTLYWVRIHTLARTNRPDPRYQSPAIAALEDRLYGESDPPASASEVAARQFRRRRLETLVDMRNL